MTLTKNKEFIKNEDTSSSLNGYGNQSPNVDLISNTKISNMSEAKRDTFVDLSSKKNSEYRTSEVVSGSSNNNE